MDFVDGWSVMANPGHWPAPFDKDLAARPGLAYELVDGAARMANVERAAVVVMSVSRGQRPGRLSEVGAISQSSRLWTKSIEIIKKYRSRHLFHPNEREPHPTFVAFGVAARRSLDAVRFTQAG